MTKVMMKSLEVGTTVRYFGQALDLHGEYKIMETRIRAEGLRYCLEAVALRDDRGEPVVLENVSSAAISPVTSLEGFEHEDMELPEATVTRPVEIWIRVLRACYRQAADTHDSELHSIAVNLQRTVDGEL